MKLKNLSSVIFSFAVFFSSFATGAEEIASRKMLPMNSAASVREISEHNGLADFFHLPFSRKKSGDSDDVSEHEIETSETEEALREKMGSAFLQQFQDELPFVSPAALTTTTPQDPVIDFPVPTPSPSVSTSLSPSDILAESPSDISPSESIPELSSIAPSSEVAEGPDAEGPDAMQSESLDVETPVPDSTESTESLESVESWPALEMEVDEELPVVEPPSSEPEDAAPEPARVIASPASRPRVTSRKEEKMETLSAPFDPPKKVEEEDSEAPAPEDNKHRHHIGRKMRIISWTLAGICISLVVVGNILGVYFSYIRPRLSRRTEYTEL